jgi:hypothetical protein
MEYSSRILEFSGTKIVSVGLKHRQLRLTSDRYYIAKGNTLSFHCTVLYTFNNEKLAEELVCLLRKHSSIMFEYGIRDGFFQRDRSFDYEDVYFETIRFRSKAYTFFVSDENCAIQLIAPGLKALVKRLNKYTWCPITEGDNYYEINPIEKAWEENSEMVTYYFERHLTACISIPKG